jgi:hypothetical protein
MIKMKQINNYFRKIIMYLEKKLYYYQQLLIIHKANNKFKLLIK